RFRHEDAQSFRSAIMPLVIAAGHPPNQQAVSTPTAAEADAADQIRKLAELRDAGIVSEEEFQTKKAELLKRM
ncbi:MAG TPA: SHOCT domain-containing protein, partial [Gaiellales bacterium]|nr:SHOCT domain-containing protein [Gaiellales bacterium]